MSSDRNWMIGNVARLLRTYRFKGLVVRLAEEYFWWIVRSWPGFEGVFFRYLFLRCTTARLDGFCWISAGCTIVNAHKLSIGKNFAVNRNILIDAIGGIEIGDNCGIGPNSVIIAQEHTTLASGDYNAPENHRARPIVIGKDVFISANCFIKSGVTIGDGAVVGAGSTVLGDLKPGARVIGAPAMDLFRALRLAQSSTPRSHR